MKNTTFRTSAVALALVVFAMTFAAKAAPIGHSNRAADYLVAADDLSRFIAGVYYDSVEHEVKRDGRRVTMDSERSMAHVGFTALPWLVPYVTIGEADTDIQGGQENGTVWGGGVWFNLVDHDLLDPILMEDRLRLRASADYLRGQGRTVSGKDLEWNEWHSALTVGVINDTRGNKRFTPQSIELFAGPVYSFIDGDIESTDEFGYTAGVAVHLTERITLDTAVEDIGDISVSVGLHVRL